MNKISNIQYLIIIIVLVIVNGLLIRKHRKLQEQIINLNEAYIEIKENETNLEINEIIKTTKVVEELYKHNIFDSIQQNITQNKKIIFVFHENNCSSCLDQEISTITKLLSDNSDYPISFIGYFNNQLLLESYLNLKSKSLNVDNIINLKNNIKDLTITKPFYLSLDSLNRPTGFYIPSKIHPKNTESYLKNIYAVKF